MPRKSKTEKPIMASHTLDILESWKRERPDIDLTNFLLTIHVMRLGRVLEDTYDRMCRDNFKISGADMRVLFALRRAGKPYARRATDLYRALLVTSGAITKQVDRLAKLGLVQRVKDPSHDAGVLVLLTRNGLKVADSASDLFTERSPMAIGLRSLNANERAAGQRFVESVLLELEAAASEETELVKPKRASSKVARRESARRSP